MITKVFETCLKVCFTSSASYTGCGISCSFSRTASCSLEVILSGFINSRISFLVGLSRSFEMIAMTLFLFGLRGSSAPRKLFSRFIDSAGSHSLRFLPMCNLLLRHLGVPRLASDMVVPIEEAMDSVSDIGSSLSADVV